MLSLCFIPHARRAPTDGPTGPRPPGGGRVMLPAPDGATAVNGPPSAVLGNVQGVHIVLHGGADSVEVVGLNLHKGLHIDAGAGDDAITVTNTSLNKSLWI